MATKQHHLLTGSDLHDPKAHASNHYASGADDLTSGASGFDLRYASYSHNHDAAYLKIGEDIDIGVYDFAATDITIAGNLWIGGQSKICWLTNLLDFKDETDTTWVDIRAGYITSVYGFNGSVNAYSQPANLTLQAQNRTTDAQAKDVIIRAASAKSTAVSYQNGGNVYIYGGDHATAGGSEGHIYITQADGATVIADFSDTGITLNQNMGITNTSPNIQLYNTSEEDTSGGRESSIIAKGEQSGGEVTTLGKIEFSHLGTDDDEKGQIRIYLNDGNDGDSPSCLLNIFPHANGPYINGWYKMESRNSAFIFEQQATDLGVLWNMDGKDFSINPGDNLALFTGGYGMATGDKNCKWGSGTAPSSPEADCVAMWVADQGAVAGKAAFHIMDETGATHIFGEAVTLDGNTTINGTLSITSLSSGLIKSDGVGAISGAIEGTDYLGFARIDDTKGNGDTDYLWSADKCFDELALKAAIASPTFTGTVTVPLLKLNTTPADTEASGLIANVTVGESVSRGDLLYIKSDGHYWKAKADASTTIPCIAIALGTIATTASGNVLHKGYLRDDNGYNLSIGGLLYVSEATAGALTQTSPSSSGNQVQIIGYAATADVIFFNPDYTYVEIA